MQTFVILQSLCCFQEDVSQRTDSDDDLDEFTCHSEMPAPKTDNSSNQGRIIKIILGWGEKNFFLID